MVEKAQNSVKIAPGGDVTTGPRTVIHPKAWIVAEAAPMIGECNIIEEQTMIINGYPENIVFVSIILSLGRLILSTFGQIFLSLYE
uniref:Dynactin subunit 6 n=1 Tax=Podarcis muralis TaxID=64176 RepID=A0A670JMD5_PODMU